MWVGLGWAGSPKPIKSSEPPPSVGRSGSENEKAVEQFENEVFLRKEKVAQLVIVGQKYVEVSGLNPV